MKKEMLSAHWRKILEDSGCEKEGDFFYFGVPGSGFPRKRGVFEVFFAGGNHEGNTFVCEKINFTEDMVVLSHAGLYLIVSIENTTIRVFYPDRDLIHFRIDKLLGISINSKVNRIRFPENGECP